jgi:hypothetical protein
MVPGSLGGSGSGGPTAGQWSRPDAQPPARPDAGRRDGDVILLVQPVAVELLRQIAVHRETALLLDLCARRVSEPLESAQFARRASQRRKLADRWLEHLTGGWKRHPSARC